MISSLPKCVSYHDFNGVAPPINRSVKLRDNHQCSVDLISDALPFGRLWYDGLNAISNAIGYAEHCGRSHDAVIRVYDDAGNVIATHEHKDDFKLTDGVPVWDGASASVYICPCKALASAWA